MSNPKRHIFYEPIITKSYNNTTEVNPTFKQTKDIKVGNRFRKDMGDIDSLAKSVQEIGLLHSHSCKRAQ